MSWQVGGRSVEGLWKGVEGLWKGVEGRWKGVEGRWKGVEGRGRAWKVRVPQVEHLQPCEAVPRLQYLDAQPEEGELDGASQADGPRADDDAAAAGGARGDWVAVVIERRVVLGACRAGAELREELAVAVRQDRREELGQLGEERRRGRRKRGGGGGGGGAWCGHRGRMDLRQKGEGREVARSCEVMARSCEVIGRQVRSWEVR